MDDRTTLRAVGGDWPGRSTLEGLSSPSAAPDTSASPSTFRCHTHIWYPPNSTKLQMKNRRSPPILESKTPVSPSISALQHVSLETPSTIHNTVHTCVPHQKYNPLLNNLLYLSVSCSHPDKKYPCHPPAVRLPHFYH